MKWTNKITNRNRKIPSEAHFFYSTLVQIHLDYASLPFYLCQTLNLYFNIIIHSYIFNLSLLSTVYQNIMLIIIIVVVMVVVVLIAVKAVIVVIVVIVFKVVLEIVVKIVW